MIATLKSEFRKLFSLRSTYVILGLALLLDIFFSFYVSGWRATQAELMNPGFLANQVVSAVNFLSLFIGLIVVLLVTHEYRYNTIMYTLTANKSRTQVLVAKFIAASCFAAVFSFGFGVIAPLLAALGVSLHGLALPHQDLAIWSLLWRSIFAGWAFASLAFILASIIRVQVGSIAAMFLIPATVEPLLGILLKGNQVYQPFSVINVSLDVQTGGNHISYVRAALIAGVYIVVGWMVALILFLRRDATT